MKIRKFLSALLSFLLIFTLSSPAFAIESTNSPTTSYTSGTISSNNTLTFVSGYSGSTYTLRSYIYPVLP